MTSIRFPLAVWLCNVRSAGLAAALSVVAMMTGRRLKRLVASTGQMTLGYAENGPGDAAAQAPQAVLSS